MATARVAEGATICRKRYDLERWLAKAGHRFPTGDRARLGQPLSGFDCIVNLWGWLDSRDDPWGRLHDCTVESVELAAGWDGAPGVLWQGLLDTGWVEHDGQGYRWHDYRAMNGRTIADRLKKREKRGAPPSPGGGAGGGTRGGTDKGTDVGTNGGTRVGTRKGTIRGDATGDQPGGHEGGPEGGVTRARARSGSGSRSGEELPLGTSGVDPRPPSPPPARTGGSSAPLALPEGAGAPLASRESLARAAVLAAEPNLSQRPARGDERTRTLQTGRTYLGRLALLDPPLHARLTVSGMRNPPPGALLREVDPEAFEAVVRAYGARYDEVAGDRAAYVRSALAERWADALGCLADRAAGRRAERRGADEAATEEDQEPPNSRAVG